MLAGCPLPQKWHPTHMSRGTFGDVFNVTTEEYDKCVVKVIRIAQSLEEQGILQKLKNVIENEKTLCTLNHQNIIKFFDMKIDSKKSIALVLMELVDGITLDKLIGKIGHGTPLDVAKTIAITKQVCDGVNYLHTLTPTPVIHRDLNTRTIMVLNKDSTTVKLIDFGLSVYLAESAIEHVSGAPRGDPWFMAPEQFRSEEEDQKAVTAYSREADIYALGCTVYHMVIGERPHNSCKNMFSLVDKVKKSGAPSLPDTCSRELVDFYKSCTDIDVSHRKSAAELLKDKFLTNEPQKPESVEPAEPVSPAEPTQHAEPLPKNPMNWTEEQLTQKCENNADLKATYGALKQTLLMIAAFKNMEDLVSQLLQSPSGKASVSAQDVSGRTAICWAALKGHSNVLTAFEKAFESDADTLKTEVNRGDNTMQTPIILAAMHHQTGVLKQLVRMGANVNSQDAIGNSALAYAAKHGFHVTVAKLLELEADCTLKNSLGNIAVTMAFRNGHTEVVKEIENFPTKSADSGSVEQRKSNIDEPSDVTSELKGLSKNCVISEGPSRSLPSDLAQRGGVSPEDDRSIPVTTTTTTTTTNDMDQPRLSVPTDGQTRSIRNSRTLVVLLINQGFTNHPVRTDSITEANQLWACLDGNDFSIRPITNAQSQTFNNLLAVVDDYNLQEIDKIVLIIMSHCMPDIVVASDGEQVRLEDVFRQFTEHQELQGKKKVFIVQELRIQDQQQGVVPRLVDEEHVDCMYIYSVLRTEDMPPPYFMIQALREILQEDLQNITEFSTLPTRLQRRVQERSGGREEVFYRSHPDAGLF